MNERYITSKFCCCRHIIYAKTLLIGLAFLFLQGAACYVGPEPHPGQQREDGWAFLNERQEERASRTESSPDTPQNERQQYDTLDIPRFPERVSGNLYRRTTRNWKYIVIHHSGTESGSMASFDRYARQERGWRGVGYHFVIGNGEGTSDGTLEVTFRWEQQIEGAHAGVERYNEQGIGICLVGNFDTGHPTEEQMKTLVSLVNFLQMRNNIPTSQIYGHGDIKNTSCPGENFPFNKFRSLLRR